MAGSYKHCTNDDGSFRINTFTYLIENLGDAYEACEEMHWMINYLADGSKERIDDAVEAFYAMKKARRDSIVRIARQSEELGDYDKFISFE